MARIFIQLLAFLCVGTCCHAENWWPQFRGPGGQGHAEARDIPLKWSEKENIRWKSALPGQGHSSPVVMGDQIWLTTALQEEATPEQQAKRKAGIPNGQSFHVAGKVSLHALCISLRNGSILHNIKVFDIEEPETVHGINSYASPSAVLEPGRAYVHFGTYGTACLDSDSGEILWTCRFPIKHFVGPGSSPVLVDDLLVIPCDGADKQFVVAVNKANGNDAWKQDRPPMRTDDGDRKKSFCTPLVIDVQGQTQVVIPGSQWIVAYDPKSGHELWRIDHGDGFSVVPRPVADERRLFFSTGFSRPAMVAVKLGGTGDITDSHVEWRTSRQAPNMPSPLLVGDRLYTASDGGVAVCLNAETGDLIWQNRLGGNYSASPLLVGDRIYFFNREGLTTVIEDSGKRPDALAENRLDGAIFATPAAIDGELILRTETHLYAIGK